MSGWSVGYCLAPRDGHDIAEYPTAPLQRILGPKLQQAGRGMTKLKTGAQSAADRSDDWTTTDRSADRVTTG